MRKHPSTIESAHRSTAYRTRPLDRQPYVCLGYPAFDNYFNWPTAFNTNSKVQAGES
jgi:hypothetical protein